MKKRMKLDKVLPPCTWLKQSKNLDKRKAYIDIFTTLIVNNQQCATSLWPNRREPQQDSDSQFNRKGMKKRKIKGQL